MGFARKQIDVTFTLASGNFQGTSSNTLSVPGLRVHLTLETEGGVAKDYSHIRIWGLTQSQMNQMSTYGVPLPGQTLNNKISVTAGDAGGAMSVVIQGTIYDAYADYSSQPDVSFVVTAYSTLYQGVAPIPSTTLKGGINVATIMGTLAKQLGLTLENSGVNVTLANPHFTGSAYDQVQDVARAGNFNAYADCVRGVLAMWPQNGARTAAGDDPILISPETGLKGYPTFSNKQIDFETLFNPSMTYGKKVKIQSSITPACGIWIPMQMTTVLQSETPGGAWFTQVHAISGGAVS
jgi:hypothetical protein